MLFINVSLDVSLSCPRLQRPAASSGAPGGKVQGKRELVGVLFCPGLPVPEGW
jgi:hypothetical protein